MSSYFDIIKMRHHYGLHSPLTMIDITEEQHEWFDFRRNLLVEELNEFTTAYKENDIVEVFDALLDIVVVAMGTAAGLGLDWHAGWDEVLRSNMQKVRSDDPKASKRGNALDLIKPDDWTPPNLEQFMGKIRKHNNFEQAQWIAKQKSFDYQNTVDREDYFPFGLLSYVQMIHIKTTRLRSLAQTDKRPNFESLRDTLLDMMNYCNFAIEHLDNKRSEV